MLHVAYVSSSSFRVCVFPRHFALIVCQYQSLSVCLLVYSFLSFVSDGMTVYIVVDLPTLLESISPHVCSIELD